MRDNSISYIRAAAAAIAIATPPGVIINVIINNYSRTATGRV